MEKEIYGATKRSGSKEEDGGPRGLGARKIQRPIEDEYCEGNMKEREEDRVKED